MPQLTTQQKSGVLVATILGSSMVFIDGTVINVILPILQKAFSANAAQIQWVVEAYLLMLASLMLIGGALGDRLGRKKVFLAGTISFIAASIGCSFAQSLLQLSILRALQGMAAALLTPSSLAIINSVFPEGERGKAIGTWSGFSALMTVFGPLLGGWLSDLGSWRWVFLINLPIGIIVLFFTLKFIPKLEPETKSGHLDWAGTLMSVLGTGAFIAGLVEHSVILFISGVMALGLFLWIETKAKNPLVPLKFFKSREFSTINGVSFFLYAALSIVFYFLPFNLIQVQGFTATQAGAANLPFVVIVFLSSRFTGSLYTKVGARIPISIGSLIAGLGFWLLGFLAAPNANYWTVFFPGLVLFGVGMALCISPLTTTVVSALEEKVSGVASAINNSVTRIAGLMGIAVATLLVMGVFEAHLKSFSWSADIQSQVLAQSNQLANIHGFSTEVQNQIQMAYLASFKFILYCTAGLAFISSALTFLLLKPTKALP